MEEAEDHWRHMQSRVEDAPDSEAEEAGEDVIWHTPYHCERELMDYEYAKKAPELDAVPTPGAVAAAKTEELNLRHLPLEEEFLQLPPPMQHQIERTYSSKAHREAWETAKHLSQNNPTSVRPRLWLNSDQIPGYRLHEVVGIEGIVHLHDLTSQMEHCLHITEPVVPFLKPPDPFQKRKDPILKFLEKHDHTAKEKAVSKVRGDKRYDWDHDFYWTSCPLN